MGVALTLLHSGITDPRQWERELRTWPYDCAAPDLETGFELQQPSILVGNSFGGRVALQLALAHPDLVRALVLVAPALPGHPVSPELEAVDAEEERLFDAGELDAAVELMVETWVPGAPAAVQAYVREAQRRSYEQDPISWLPPFPGGVEAIRCPVLLVDGELDRPEFHAIADTLERTLPDVRGRVSIPGAYHLPNLERPAEFDAAVLPFLASLT